MQRRCISSTTSYFGGRQRQLWRQAWSSARGVSVQRVTSSPSPLLRTHIGGQWRFENTAASSRQLYDISESTIYALSTAPGRAAIAIIRISGPACKGIYQLLCPGKRLPNPRLAAFRQLHLPGDPSEILDSGALVLFMPSPNTVTGEDVLELHVHGGPAIVRSVLSAIPRCASIKPDIGLVQYAGPGEFTRRAFMNDRMSLTQIEALGETLSAVTEEQRRLSVKGTTSSLSQRYDNWRSLLLSARGELEALIDFSEDQHFDESPVELAANVAVQITNLLRYIRLHSMNAVRGELLRNGISIALIGSPNVGKSSLLNLVIGRNAAIVSEQAGTTRDIVEVGVDIGGFFCRLSDTAGLRNGGPDIADPSKAVGEIEKEGIARAKQKALESDLVILVLAIESVADDQGVTLQVDPEVILTANELLATGKKVLVVINKIDKYTACGNIIDAMASKLSDSVAAFLPGLKQTDIFSVSCHEGALTTRDQSGNGIIITKATTADGPEPQSGNGTTRTRPRSSHGSNSLEYGPNSGTGTTWSRTDPGYVQKFLSGLVTAFRELTHALTPDETGGDVSVWAESLGTTERQRILLDACAAHLQDFLDQVSDARRGTDPVTDEGAEISHQDEVDIVAAAESLRSAADCLAQITGRGEQSDVEEVLGVIFER